MITNKIDIHKKNCPTVGVSTYQTCGSHTKAERRRMDAGRLSEGMDFSP